jgi:hypothetical protein
MLLQVEFMGELLVQFIPFWILDFGFWIGDLVLSLDSVNVSVASFFQIGIRYF